MNTKGRQTMKTKGRPILYGNKGQAVILVAVAFAFLAMLTGLAVDAGRAYVIRARLDRMADAAAVGGAKALAASDGDEAYALQAACAIALMNAAAGGGDAESCPPGVVAAIEPVVLPDGSAADAVVVTATETMNTSFLRLGTLLGCGDTCRQVNIGSGESAAVAFSEPACVYALNETVDHALELNGTGDLDLSNCGAYIRSASADAVQMNGNTTINAASVRVVGGVSASANSSINPTPKTGVPWQPDPLAHLPEPAPPAGTCQPQPDGKMKSFTPGRYCTIDLKGGDEASFDPGLYYIDNGFSASGSSEAYVDAFGEGVTIYIDSGAVNITGNSQVALAAPTSGVYEGITFFQKRTNTSTAVITGSHELRAGGLYFAGAALEFRGGVCEPNDGMMIVADTILISGSTCVSMPDAVSPEAPVTAALIR